MKKFILVIMVTAQLQPVYGMWMSAGGYHTVMGFAEAGDMAIDVIVDEIAKCENLSPERKSDLRKDLSRRKESQGPGYLQEYGFVAPKGCRIRVLTTLDILKRYIKHENSLFLQDQLRRYIKSNDTHGADKLLREFAIDVNAKDENGISFLQHALNAQHAARYYEEKLSQADRIVQLLKNRGAIEPVQAEEQAHVDEQDQEREDQQEVEEKSE